VKVIFEIRLIEYSTIFLDGGTNDQSVVEDDVSSNGNTLGDYFKTGAVKE